MHKNAIYRLSNDILSVKEVLRDMVKIKGRYFRGKYPLTLKSEKTQENALHYMLLFFRFKNEVLFSCITVFKCY